MQKQSNVWWKLQGWNVASQMCLPILSFQTAAAICFGLQMKSARSDALSRSEAWTSASNGFGWWPSHPSSEMARGKGFPPQPAPGSLSRKCLARGQIWFHHLWSDGGIPCSMMENHNICIYIYIYDLKMCMYIICIYVMCYVYMLRVYIMSIVYIYIYTYAHIIVYMKIYTHYAS